VSPKARTPERKGTESSLARYEAESLAKSEKLMEDVCEPRNLKQALKRVKANAGSPGIDRMTTEELAPWLMANWTRIREELITGQYQPQPVRRKTIAKPDGGTRELGIPTVIDRFVQQAVLQILERIWDPTFSESSYGFRAQRSAHQAIEAAQGYIRDGSSTLILRNSSTGSTMTGSWLDWRRGSVTSECLS
jgi:RNA-directed DNA polymerase